jgi:transcriptional regulator with XRE-family HTH domain
MGEGIDKNILGRKIKELRAAKHWSQDELAERAELKRSHVQRLEHGDYKESKVTTLVKVARAFGIHPCTFMVDLGLLDPNELVQFAGTQDKALALRLSSPDIWVFFTEDWQEMDHDTQELIRRYLQTVKQLRK